MYCNSLPDTTIKQKRFFLARNLTMYRPSTTTMPIVVTGDFNIDVSKDENASIVDFMRRCFGMDLASDPTQATTLGGTVLDLTFTRGLRVECRRYCSYFSYHRPILSVLAMPCGEFVNTLEENQTFILIM